MTTTDEKPLKPEPELEAQIKRAQGNYLRAIKRGGNPETKWAREFMRLKRLERGVEDKR